MTDELLHVLDFIHEDQYETEDYPEELYSTTASTHLPEPSVGETVSIGWHEENGERVDHVNLHDEGLDSDIGYGQSDSYEVLAVERHYHHSRKRGHDGGWAENQIEVATTVIVTEADE